MSELNQSDSTGRWSIVVELLHSGLYSIRDAEGRENSYPI